MAPRRRTTVAEKTCTTNDMMTGGRCSGRVATLWEWGEKASRVLTIRRRSRPDPGNERRELQAEAQPG